MKISRNEGNISINMTAQDNTLENVNGKKENQEQKTGSIFAGDINMNQTDSVAEKKMKAQRQALKSIMTAYDADKSIDDCQDAQRDRNKTLEANAEEAVTEMDKLDELRKSTQEAFEITEDSQEQKDLELMQKQKAILKGKSNETLTEEEKERLANMGPKTEYQLAMLEYDDIEETWNDTYEKSVKEITSNNRVISAVEVDRLKFSPMVSASKEADKIMEAASKEIIGMLKDEAVKHIDEKLEEEKEKAEEIKDKKEEEEEKKEEIKAQQAGDNINTAAKVEEVQSKLDAEIKKMQNEMLEEDIKGLSVDKRA